jgi:hypothetical protein
MLQAEITASQLGTYTFNHLVFNLFPSMDYG